MAGQAEVIRGWCPWERSTGLQNDCGKARSGRNAYRGGQWHFLREATKVLNAVLKAHREAVDHLNRSRLWKFQVASSKC
jgi:hypothetical protein